MNNQPHLNNTPSASHAEKLKAALEFLGSKHVLAKKIGRLENPQKFFLKGN